MDPTLVSGKIGSRLCSTSTNIPVQHPQFSSAWSAVLRCPPTAAPTRSCCPLRRPPGGAAAAGAPCYRRSVPGVGANRRTVERSEGEGFRFMNGWSTLNELVNPCLMCKAVRWVELCHPWNGRSMGIVSPKRQKCL